jgi:CheY-like chemotaxis protein
LIVDDTVANLLAFSAILKQLDCRLVVASNGREALERAEEEDFTLILMDVRMPELNGFEAAASIRSRSRNRGTPILFLSAFETPPFHVFSSFVGGHTDFLSSPVDAETLLRKVREFLLSQGGKEQKDPSDPRLQKTSSTSEERPAPGLPPNHPRPSGGGF